jgi:indole-3-glycerol phosphate synthase
MENSLSLRNLVPKGQLFVAESGMSKPEELRRLEEAGVNAVLIGESLMRAESKKEKLQELRSLLK